MARQTMPGESNITTSIAFRGRFARVEMHAPVVTLVRASWLVVCGLGEALRAMMAVCCRLAGAGVCLLVSGCIIPLAPEFEPPGSNLSPYIVSASPPVGSLLNEQEEIVVVLADPNLSDQLFVKWSFNYPDTDTNISRFSNGDTLPPTLGASEVRNQAARIRPACLLDLVRGISQHRVMLIVSDRPFIATPDNPFGDAVSEDAHVVRATWLMRQECL